MELDNEKLLSAIKTELDTTRAEYEARLAEIKAKEAQARQEKQKRQHSQELVTKTSNLFLQKSVEKGNLDSESYRKIYDRTYSLYGQQKAQELFVKSVISLLSHKHYGVESKTAKFGNGGLIFRGQAYDSPDALYKGVMTVLHGELGADFDPLGGSEWFDIVLDKIFEDPTYLPAEICMPEHFTKYVQGLVAVNKMSQTNPVEVPDADDLTLDDMIYLQDLLGLI